MNPLYNMLFGKISGQNVPLGQQTANGSSDGISALMGQLRANPAEMIKNAGYNVPAELSGDPQSAVMHMLRTGQIGGPAMQRIAPFLNQMGIK